MKLTYTLAAFAATALAANAATVVAEYDYATGFDPTGQGWTLTGGNNTWSSTYDNGSALEINDGTSSALTYFSHTIALSGAFTASVDLTLNSDLRNGDNDSLLADWHRTNDNNTGHTLWFENATEGYFYLINVSVQGEDLYMSDGTTSTLLSAGNGFDTAFNFTLAYDGTDATVSYNGGTGIAVASNGTGGSDRVIFGMPSSTPMGSAEYTNVTVTAVPEPSASALLGLGGLALILRRRK